MVYGDVFTGLAAGGIFVHHGSRPAIRPLSEAEKGLFSRCDLYSLPTPRRLPGRGRFTDLNGEGLLAAAPEHHVGQLLSLVPFLASDLTLFAGGAIVSAFGRAAVGCWIPRLSAYRDPDLER
jgi:hypothetical protein